MHKVINKDGVYTVTTESGKKYTCPVDKTGVCIVLPKEAAQETGRKFISLKVVGDRYEFETKTAEARTLGSRLIPEAQAQVDELQRQIAAIKQDPANHATREKVDPNSEEGLELAIKRYADKLAALKAKRQNG